MRGDDMLMIKIEIIMMMIIIITIRATTIKIIFC
jgi:hypothetical protein